MKILNKEIILKSFEVGEMILSSPYCKKSTIEEPLAQADFYKKKVSPKIKGIAKNSPNVLFRQCLEDILLEFNLVNYGSETFPHRGNNLLPYCWAGTRPPHIKKVKDSPQLYILVESEWIRFGFDYGKNIDKNANEVNIVKENISLQRKIFNLLKSSANLDLYSAVEDHTNYKKKLITVNSISDIKLNWSNEIQIMRAIHKSDLDDDIETIIRRTLAELLPIYQLICTGRETREMSNLMKKLIKKIQPNRQLIITGAPGTGKTFAAKKLAVELCDINENDPHADFQIGFVQFHPSYDYTDFIDGLKPEINDSDNMKFIMKNGVFKEFCSKAGVIERILFNAKNKNVEGSLLKIINNNLKEYCKSNEICEEFWSVWVNKNKKFLEETDLALLDDNNKYIQLTELLPEFTFIIDEINRGEIAKIFGELMFCLEPGYRGFYGVINTQYSSLSTEGCFYTNPENDKFFVPSNLYLIGTMNDIDRSVDIFDFALRRRFAWHDIKVTKEYLLESLQEMLKGTSWAEDSKLKELTERAVTLNEKFLDQDGPMLGNSYQLGPAYFKKIAFYGDNVEAYNELWENHIEPLILEYMRGNNNYSDFIYECKKALVKPQNMGDK